MESWTTTSLPLSAAKGLPLSGAKGLPLSGAQGMMTAGARTPGSHRRIGRREWRIGSRVSRAS